MSDEGLANNPFAALFPSISHAKEFRQQANEETPVCTQSSPPDGSINAHAAAAGAEADNRAVSNFIERVFLITLNTDATGDGRPGNCVFLQDLSDGLKDQIHFDWDTLSQAVFERLMLSDPGEYVITTSHAASGGQAAKAAAESVLLKYLCDSFLRLQHEKYKDKSLSVDWVGQCESVIVSNTRMCLQHPEVFGDLNMTKQFMEVYLEQIRDGDEDGTNELFERVSVDIEMNAEEGSLADVFRPILDRIKQLATSEFSLGNPSVFMYLDLLMFFTRTPSLSELFVAFNQPTDTKNGKGFEQSLLGSIVSISCIVKNEAGPFEFFDKPSRYSKQEHDITENSIHQPISILNERVYQLLLAILKHGGETRHQILEWLGNCLHANLGRGKMWSHHMPMLFTGMYASDGFFVNLCAVLLRLCKPFSQAQSAKILKVQPSYCQATVGDRAALRNKNVHMKELAEETCLIPPAEGEQHHLVADNYNFITECFFMTHHCIHLGLHVVSEKFLKLNQELHRIQGLYNDIVQGGGESSEMGQRIKDQMEKGMTVFLCMKAALTEPKLLDLCFNFNVATSNFLVHQATSSDPSQFTPVTFPLPDRGPSVLSCIPEFTTENILDFLLFVRRFRDVLYEVEGERLHHLMTLVLVFMGSPSHMRNPHLRARMAEALEALMPPKDSQSSMVISHYHREQLFEKHSLIDQLAPTLLHVFVSIEMTGQGVQFEQKFNYRRPMYTILEYIWDINRHKNVIKSLSRHAETHIEDTDAPLFLRFINLLINDAIFLLDEALQYMSQIKEKQEEQDSGAWSELPANQRQENENSLRQLTMLARFHNIMGNDTIHILELITREIKSIFVHDVMVDRIAAMLNYFLLHLVGPKKKNLKVKDFDKYDFKPQELVSNICKIYLNLGDCDSFCLAVSRDGRSYSHELFLQAEKVLQKIRQPQDVIGQFTELGAKVKVLGTRQEEEEEAMGEAPEEFLDAIMGTLMKDPVLLPSGNIVDRPTIARHLLSDQTDPFNRQTLSMDMVKPADELRQKIHDWINEHLNR